MALYLQIYSHAPSLPDVPVTYPYIKVDVKGFTTPDFQPASQVSFYNDSCSFSTDVPVTGNTYTAYGTIPDGISQTYHSMKQAIDGSLNYNTTYHFQATVTGHYGADEAEVVSDNFDFTTESDPNPPSKSTNPTPSNGGTRVDFSGLVLDWDDGGGADTFDVHIGPVGSLIEVASAIVPTTYTVSTDDVPWGETVSWRVDATNDAGTTTGDVWSFDNVIIRSVWLGSGGSFLVVTAKDGVYLSTDFAENWTRKTPDDTEDTDWVKGICSSTGTYIIVVSSANAIYRSANSGTAWAEITPAGGDTFSVNKLATSDDGQYMVIVGQNSTDATESCYISTDYGATWTAKKPVDASIEWTECDISNDGAIIAVSTTSNFYISLDSGATWLEQGMASSAEVWEGLSISGDGTTGLIANIDDNDEFFIGTNTELYSEATWAESSLTSAGRALLDDADAPAQATTLGLGTGDTPEFVSSTLSDLTASRLVWGDASKALASKDLVDLITGTENRVTVSDDVAGGVTVSAPQDLHLDATPEWAGTVIKDSGDNIIFYVDNDEMYFTGGAIPIAAGMPIGLALILTYASS